MQDIVYKLVPGLQEGESGLGLPAPCSSQSWCLL